MLLSSAALLTLIQACGSDGKDGAQGPAGAPGATGADGAAGATGTVGDAPLDVTMDITTCTSATRLLTFTNNTGDLVSCTAGVVNTADDSEYTANAQDDGASFTMGGVGACAATNQLLYTATCWNADGMVTLTAACTCT